jgi:protein gp37
MGSHEVVRFDPTGLRKLERAKRPRVWSVWADLFHESIDNTTILSCLLAFERARDQTILVLTKRPERAERLWTWAIPNAWIGTSAENQETFDARWPHIERIYKQTWTEDAYQRTFLSAEPLLGPISIWRSVPENLPDAVVAGPETGPHARPMDEKWMEKLNRECFRYGASFLRKDWNDGVFETTNFWRSP